ncbi:FUSC family protein [Marinoscillum sp.]|uniref:FUSC family protein n=1 Tax=Marinoscillum sp. TaxID=2024838 RepID=UPI0032F89A03
MNQKELSELSDQELMEEAKKIKPSPLVDAFFIGFLVGIIIYSAVKNTWGFLTLIPLFMIYGLLKKSKRYEALKNELKERDLQ